MDTDPDLVAAAIYGAMTATGSFLATMDSGVTLGPITVRLGTDGGEAIVGVHESTAVGPLANTSPPPNVAVLVHKRTQRGGRRGRGRLFIPWGVAENSIDEAGMIDATTASTLQGRLETMRTELATRGVPMYVLHEPGRTTPGPPNLVTTLTVDRLVATQRRRMGR